MRPLTEEMIDSSASVSSVSMEPLLKRNRASDRMFSHRSPAYPIGSLYDRFIGKSQLRERHRQADDCETGNNH